MREFTKAEVNRHNALTKTGWALIEGRLIIQGQEPSGCPGWFTRWQLSRAICCFEQALTINPDSWASMWALGKIQQRLGNQEAAFAWFAKAHVLEPNQPDVAREAGIAALDLGRLTYALAFCRLAVECRPSDAGLICNLALAYCLAGNDSEAVRCVTEAAERDPSDIVTANVKHFIREVATGQRMRPPSLLDVFPYC